MMDRPKDPTLKTTARSLALIDRIQERGGANLPQLAEDLSLAKSTVYKHVSTLYECGYLVKEGDEYHIGPKFLDLGEHARSRKVGYQFADDAVRELTDATDEEVDFVIEDHGRVVTISESYHKWVKHPDESDSNRYRARMGTYYHMHATASGKAILAELPRERTEAILDRWGLPANTDNTITDHRAFFEELERVDDRGYAIDDEEFTAGLRSVGMAVDRPDGPPIGAMSVSGPSYRITDEVIDQNIVPVLERTVESFERRLANDRSDGP
ncbi:transcriptional regulator, IclR family (plasmid) [Haloterrigena turkmenica DSM 5511]|uniref:Transcriptional regulator, IclR family n=1 Tax=Haloterrigena turkmenica (strain ATCC 51198 / DSM 5511 / JCM 9101 / NCIMB 13204 / VKM B-1734 / 4k) TaxID=543526 RepID=D2S2A7_HALTV|nr:IclR family transcriptional regulator [Haloterrigena turkmenica]ADB63504.1 transcriptional regulator, IclR family [Haloterrigena turkmenica DSM 5511]